MATMDWIPKLPQINSLNSKISRSITTFKSSLTENAIDTEEARIDLLDSIDELRDLLLKPRELLLQGIGSGNFLAMHAMQRFNIAKNIPIGGTGSYSELAAACGLPEKACKRFVRQACLVRVLCEPQPNVVGHTSASELMVQNPHVHDYVGAICEEVWPAAVKTMYAISKWPDSADPKHSGYALANGMPVYELPAQDKRRSDQYASSMEAFAGDSTYSFDLVLGDYDWAGLGDATIVDVGGSLANLPEVIAKAKQEPLAAAIKDRIRFLAHDMFQAQLVKHAPIYYFRSIMFDWPNDKVVEILKAQKAALNTGSRILIQDSFVSEPGVVPRIIEGRLRATELLGLALEIYSVRDLQEWREIFDDCGSGFEFVRAES